VQTYSFVTFVSIPMGTAVRFRLPQSIIYWVGCALYATDSPQSLERDIDTTITQTPMTKYAILSKCTSKIKWLICLNISLITCFRWFLL
jgi:hypothetical protein